MATKKLTLREVAEEATGIYSAWAESAYYDSGFDGGEFSGPAASRAADRAVRELAEKHGYTYEEVTHEINVLCHEQYLDQMADDGPYGRIV